MKKQDSRETNNQQSVIEDLVVNQAQAAEVKGSAESQTFFAYESSFRGGVHVG